MIWVVVVLNLDQSNIGFDSDGDELGSGEPSLFCINQQPNGWVLNTDDLFPDCFDNFYDHCGICGGDGSDDLGCGCFEPEALEYCEDSDFDGLGSPGTETEFCLDNVPENWLINCSDPYPECDGDVDYCGVCNGNGLDDLGCGCFEPAALPYWEDIDNDGLGFGDYIDFCLSDVPSQWVQNNNDLEPECNSNDTDQCGVCGGDNSTCSGCMDQLAYNYDCLPDNIPDQGEGCGDNITIDNGTCIYRPEEFDFNQSTAQVFYFIELADISNDSLSYFEDWIAAFKDDVCVGSIPWTGAYTTVPAMGNDNTEWTQDYLVPGDFPTFKIYDSSDDTFYDTEVIFDDSYNGYYQNNDFYTITSMRALVPDCAGIAGGSSFIDECGNCICGYRVGINNEENGGDLILSSDEDSVCDDQLFGEVLPYDNRPCTQDCHGIYGGLAIVDNCGMCSEGETGVIANADNLGCGCFVEGPQDYWFDADGDSLGSGDSVSLCLDDVTDVWVQNSDDIEPLCETNDTDDCGICSGGNMDKDCAGICFGTSLIDECGECGGDGTSCLAPVAESQSLNLSEDSSILLTLTGYNVSENHSSLDFLIVSNPINGSLSGNLPTLTYTPNLNFNGLDSFEFIVTNNQYSSEPALVSLSISPENDAPITYDVQQTLLENQSLEIEFIGMDIDGDTISFNLISGPLNGSLEYDDELLSYIYTPNENYFGLDSFIFTAFDGEIESVPATAYLTIEGVNNPPDIVEIPNQIMNEDDSLYINISAIDVEGDDLIYSANTNDNADIVMDGSIILIIPEQDYYGLLEVFISVNDGQDASVQQIDINVLPINDAPVLGTILAQNTLEDHPINIALDLFDVDQDFLEIIVEPSDNAIFEINSDTLTIIPNQDYFGQFIVDLYVSDGELVDSGEFTVFVSSINDSPQLSFIGNQSIEEDSTLTLQLFSDDAEGDEITFTCFF